MLLNSRRALQSPSTASQQIARGPLCASVSKLMLDVMLVLSSLEMQSPRVPTSYSMRPHRNHSCIYSLNPLFESGSSVKIRCQHYVGSVKSTGVLEYECRANPFWMHRKTLWFDALHLQVSSRYQKLTCSLFRFRLKSLFSTRIRRLLKSARLRALIRRNLVATTN